MVTEAELHAWLDGELPAERRADVESYLALHPQDAERLAAYGRQNDALRTLFDPVLDEPVPQRLRERPARRRYFSVAWLRFAAWPACLLLGAVIGWQLHAYTEGGTAPDVPPWARRAVVAHVVYSPEVRHPVEVGADQEAHLVNWLSKRLGLPLRIPQLQQAGYALVGGRLLPGDRGPVAQFMYQDARGRRLTLYLRSSGADSRETAFRYARENTVSVFYWVDRKLGYALSGEVEKDELLSVADLVYRQFNNP